MMDQFDRLNAMLRPLPLTTNLFSPNSRYFGLPIRLLDLPDGTQVAYLCRRFVPQSDRFTLLQTYAIEHNDRLDNLASQFLGDPEQFWRLCDANLAQRPEALTETPGTLLRITLPEGLQGLGNA